MKNYSEFTKEYNWALKKYPNVSACYDNDMPIKLITTQYTKSSKKWVENVKEVETINNMQYMNIVDAIPFFRNLSGFERVITTYTKKGLLPTTIISISPDKVTKIVREFKF